MPAWTVRTWTAVWTSGAAKAGGGLIRNLTHSLLGVAALVLGAGAGEAQGAQDRVISDEEEVPPYTLPAALLRLDGSLVLDAALWPERRAEIHGAFESEVYGRSPAPTAITWEVLEEGPAFGGLARRKQIAVRLRPASSAESGLIEIGLLLYVPREAPGVVPAFLTLNFDGNHTVANDPEVILGSTWGRQNGEGVVERASKDSQRGSRTSRYSAQLLIERGYGFATAYYGDIDPDFDDGFQNGVHSLFNESLQHPREPDQWGSLAGWAWGMSRLLDYLEVDASVDGSRVAVLGFSRLGKAALWAGANDERFAAVISNDSGCGGAALSRRRFGETVAAINERFPHWFARNFRQYNRNEDALPVDQHLLLALIAPRPLYVASASKDQWADPHGEFLAAVRASPVYELLGVDGLATKVTPGPDEAVLGTVSYHLRKGPHDLTEWDWQRYLDFADEVLRDR